MNENDLLLVVVVVVCIANEIVVEKLHMLLAVGSIIEIEMVKRLEILVESMAVESNNDKVVVGHRRRLLNTAVNQIEIEMVVETI